MNSSESWDLQIDSSVFKTFQKIPRHDAEALLAVMRLLPTHPYFGDIQKMKGKENTWRRRVGAYRIFYKMKVTEKTILVFRVERRTSKTY